MEVLEEILTLVREQSRRPGLAEVTAEMQEAGFSFVPAGHAFPAARRLVRRVPAEGPRSEDSEVDDFEEGQKHLPQTTPGDWFPRPKDK